MTDFSCNVHNSAHYTKKHCHVTTSAAARRCTYRPLSAHDGATELPFQVVCGGTKAYLREKNIQGFCAMGQLVIVSSTKFTIRKYSHGLASGSGEGIGKKE